MNVREPTMTCHVAVELGTYNRFATPTSRFVGRPATSSSVAQIVLVCGEHVLL